MAKMEAEITVTLEAQIIEDAILQERKRCADIAKLARNDAEFYGNPEMRRAASLIAHRIEAGE